MILGRGIIAQERRRLVHIHDDKIQITIVVEVSEGTAAAGMLRRHARTSFVAHLLKTSIAQIAKDNTWALVWKLRKDFPHFGIYISRNQENIGVAVVVEIYYSCSPTDKAGFLADAGWHGHVIEVGLTRI